MGAFILDMIIIRIATETVLVLIAPLWLHEPSSITILDWTLSLLVIPLFYWSYLTYKFGATPGKKIFSLKVISTDGSELTFKRLIYRESIWKSISTLVLGLGYITAFFNDERLTWHDKRTQTQVVE